MDIRAKLRPLWSPVLLISLVSAFFLTIEKVVDSVISNNYAIADNPLTAASAYLFVGGWFGLITSVLLGLYLGKHIPSHEKIMLPKGQPFFLSILAGISAALSTLVFLWGNQLFDLSIMVGISNGYVLLIIIYEWMRGKVKAKVFLIPGIITVAATALVAFNPAWFTDSETFATELGQLLIVIVVFNLLVAFDRLVTKPAVDESDPINVQLVRMGTLAITGSITGLVIAVSRNEIDGFVLAIQTILTTPAVYFFLFLLFASVFLGQTFELWAKKQNLDVSSVVVVIGMHVGLGFLAALLIDLVVPGFVGAVPDEWTTLAIRLTGVVILIFATILMQNNKSKNED